MKQVKNVVKQFMKGTKIYLKHGGGYHYHVLDEIAFGRGGKILMLYNADLNIAVDEPEDLAKITYWRVEND